MACGREKTGGQQWWHGLGGAVFYSLSRGITVGL